MQTILKPIFIQLMHAYTSVSNADGYWQEIETRYGESSRYYHDFSHLEHMYHELESVRNEISNWDAILLAMYYHDVIYDVSRSDNEQKSAMFMSGQLSSVVPNVTLAGGVECIYATASHNIQHCIDINLFTDADLSILGQSWDDYQQYAANVRNEYRCYTDAAYSNGRQKVLSHFLRMTKLYKTIPFIVKYEKQARKNINRELIHLKKQVAG